MGVWFHRYSLNPRRRLSGVARPGPREGALLRFDDGFADLHPWPELGNATLDEQLAALRRGHPTPQVRASRRLAAADGDARRRGVSLFAGLTIPESHWTGPDPVSGFDTAKVKGVEDLPDGVRLRVDFNATLDADEFLAVAARLPRERIDFVEDPVRFDPATWRALRKATGLRLALDLAAPHGRFAESDGVDVIVHKPAVHERFPEFEGEIAVTTYMDHPVGQFGAAWVAASNRVSPRCGLFTHVLFQPDPFIERVCADGARLLPPAGTGVGFDDLLEALPWKALR